MTLNRMSSLSSAACKATGRESAPLAAKCSPVTDSDRTGLAARLGIARGTPATSLIGRGATSLHAHARRFPPLWIIDEHAESFIVKDTTGQALGYFYFEDEPGRRLADVRFRATAVIDCVSSETARSRMTHLGRGGLNRHRARRTITSRPIF